MRRYSAARKRSRTWPPPEGGLVLVNGQVGRLVGGRDGRYLGAYLAHGPVDYVEPEKRKLLVGTAKQLGQLSSIPPANTLPTDAHMEAVAIEAGLRKAP